MLGPLAVDDRFFCHGIGAHLMAETVAQATALGHGAMLLAGDTPYYRRFGFERRHTLMLAMPGPVEAERLLELDLTPGALALARIDQADKRRRSLGVSTGACEAEAAPGDLGTVAPLSLETFIG